MATTNVIKMQIQFRRDTAANWELHRDVIPADGEPCFIIDKNILKIGDGKSHFWQLEPINGVNFEIAADGKSIVLKDNVLKLMGFDGADVGAQLTKGENGEIKWIVPSTETVDGLKTTVASLQTDVGVLKTDVSGLKTNVGNLQTDIDGLKEIVGSSDEGTGTLLSRVEGLESKMDGVGEGSVDAKIDAKINAWATEVTENKTIDTIKETIDYVAKHGSEVAAIVGEITDLRNLVGSDPVKDQIAAAVSGKVDKVNGMGLSSNNFTNELLDKLNGIEKKAQVNVIEKINVGGSLLDVVEKSVEIPVASLDRVGVVKSSTGANKVNISNSGEMSVNKVSVRSIFVPIGDELILDGGSASKNTPVYPTRVGNMGFESISDAVNHADNGDVVTLQEDVNMGTGDNDHLVINAENVTIDLGGKTLAANGSNGAVKVEGGVTTLDGDGAVQSTLGSDKYSMAVWAESGTVVINDGIYKNETDGSDRGTDLIYASGTGCIEINGGIFEAAKPEWTLNVKDADYKAGTAKIIVKGGSFKGFDPANNNAEGAGTNFVAVGYKSVEKDGYYVVEPV